MFYLIIVCLLWLVSLIPTLIMMAFTKLTCWLWRNPSQYFDYWIVGMVVKRIVKTVVYGDAAVRDDKPFKAGWCLKLLYTEDRTIPYLRIVWKWPGLEKCIDIKLGYAVWENVKEGDRAKLVFSLGLFSKITR